jgi:hypothetical protein
VLGSASREIITVDVDGGQTPLLTDHWSAFGPTERLVTVAMFIVGLLIEAEPFTTDQTPKPIAGMFAFKVVELAHTVALLPALAVLGKLSRVMSTVDVDAGQMPFVTDHRRTFGPIEMLLTADTLSVLLLTDKAPPITDQVPVPTSGLRAFSVAVVAHTVRLLPALAVLGKSSRMISTVDVAAGQTPFTTDH